MASHASHVFHEIYLHFNWHTKNSHPLLTAELEPLVHQHRACSHHQRSGGGTERSEFLRDQQEPRRERCSNGNAATEWSALGRSSWGSRLSPGRKSIMRRERRRIGWSEQTGKRKSPLDNG